MPTVLKSKKKGKRFLRSKLMQEPTYSLKGMRERRAEAYAAMDRLRRSMHDSGKGRFTPEQRQEWDRATKDFNRLSRDISREEQYRAARKEIDAVEEDGIDTFQERTGNRSAKTEAKITHETRNLALQAWFMTSSGMTEKLSREHRRACKLVGLDRRSSELNINLYRSSDVKALQQSASRCHPMQVGAQARAFSINSVADGASMTMPAMVNSLEVALIDASGIMQVADQIVTDHGNPLKWPTVNDTSTKGRRIGANKKVAAGKTDVNAVATWNAWKYTSDGIQLEQEMIEDAGFDIASYIPQMGADRIARIFNDEATLGSGSGEPDGLLNAPVGLTSATTGAVIPADIIRFLGKLDPSYLQGAAIMGHQAIFTEIATMTDGQGNFIWKAGLEMGQPDRIRGYPIVFNVSMPNAIAAGALVLAFGQMKAIKVRRVRGMRIYRSRDNDYDVDKFYCYIRMDSKVLDAGTHPIILLKVKP